MHNLDPCTLVLEAASRADLQASPEVIERLRHFRFTYMKTYASRTTLLAQAALNAN